MLLLLLSLYFKHYLIEVLVFLVKVFELSKIFVRIIKLHSSTV